MPRWEHKLSVKELFEPDAEDHDEVARRIGPLVAERVRALAKKVEAKDAYLSIALEDCADYFADCEGEERAQSMFNDALNDLYDLGDRYRIWIG